MTAGFVVNTQSGLLLLQIANSGGSAEGGGMGGKTAKAGVKKK